MLNDRIDPAEFEKPATIAEDDERRHRCHCGLMMLGNGHAEIRFGLLDYLFPPDGGGAK